MASLSRPAPTGRANPSIQLSEARSAIAPQKQFINSRPATVLIEAGPDGQFIKASSNGKFIKAQWQFYQGARTAILSKVVQRPLYQGQAQWRVYQSQSNCSFIKASFNNAVNHSQWPLYQSQWPFYQGLQFSSKVAAAQLDFSSGGPIQYCAAQAIYQRTIAVSSRQAVTTLVYRSQWPLYQSQWPFYQGRPILAKEEFRGKNLWV